MEKQLFDENLQKKKILLNTLYREITSLSEDSISQFDQNTLENIKKVKNNGEIQNIISEINKLKESNAANFDQFQAIQASNLVKKIGSAKPSESVKDNLLAIESLISEIEEMKEATISNCELVRKFSVM